MRRDLHFRKLGLPLPDIASQDRKRVCGGENFGRPYGTFIVLPLHPALKRGAKLGCPSGACVLERSVASVA